MRRIVMVLLATMVMTIPSITDCGIINTNDVGTQQSSSQNTAPTQPIASESSPTNNVDNIRFAGDSAPTGDKAIAGDSAPAEDSVSIVYMTEDISPAGLSVVYNALEVNPVGKVAVKISTGEPPNSNYLRPELIKDLVQSVNGTIVECNTAYGGSRASAAMHMQVAKDHGFTEIADFDLMDADGYISLPVEGGAVLAENFVGANFVNYDFYIILSHFKGHAMAGYGGAIKNTSIGVASSRGKSWIHSGGKKTSGIGGSQDAFLMAMAEANKSVSDALNGGNNIIYINVMNRLSVDCDCNGNPAEPDMHDIGILASRDPVALDRAYMDLVYAAPDGASLIKRIESRNGVLAIEHGEAIGLGTTQYNLVTPGD